MKKIFACIITAGLLFTDLPSNANTANVTSIAIVAKKSDAATAGLLLNRLNEIRSLSKTELTAPEKKTLRKEVRSIQHQLAGINGGVYISAGAVILIVILLIILL